MEMRLILTAFIAISIGLTRGKPIKQASSHSSEVQGNLRDLFDSIKKNDAKNIENVRNILGQEAAQEQQAFDTAKDELRLARQKSVHRQKDVEHLAAFKREANEEKKPALPEDGPDDNVVVHSEELSREMKDLDCDTILEVRAAAKPILRAKIKAEKENKILRDKIRDLKNNINGYSAAQLKLLYRQAIEEVEGEFPQEYEDDYNEKKVVWDKKILATKTGFDLREEKRRQKWLWYAQHPPNERMKNIVKHAEERGLTKEELASGIAKAHRRLSSEDIHDGKALVNQILDPVKFYRSRSVVQSLRVVLEDADIMEEYKPKFPDEHGTHAPPK